MKCDINDRGCIYHACMSNDCQKDEVLKHGVDWGSIPIKDCPEFQKARNEVIKRIGIKKSI